MSVLDRIGLPAAVGIAGTVSGLVTNAARQITGLENRDPGEGARNHDQGVANFNKYGVLKTNLFYVEFATPKVLKSSASNDPQVFRLYADNASLPGLQLGLTSARRYGIGPQHKFPNDVIFNDITVQFIADGAGSVLNYLNAWMKSIVRFDDPFVAGEDTTSRNGLEPFMFEYKEKYQSEALRVVVFNEKRDQVAVYTMREAFPVAISDVALGWGNNDELMRISVNFAYTNWKQETFVDSLQTKLNVSPQRPELTATGMMFQGATTALMFSAYKKPQNVGDVINVVNNAGVLARTFGF